MRKITKVMAESDHRIRDRRSESDGGGARQDSETHESIHTRVLPVGYERGAREALAGSRADAGSELVADEADDPRGREPPEVREVTRTEESLDRLRDAGADEDSHDDAQASKLLGTSASQEERDTER